MSYKPDIATLIDYLYGELSEDIEAKVADYLKKNPSALQELQELESTKKIMGRLQDKEVSTPSFVFDDNPVVVLPKEKKWNRFMTATAGIAASIAILMCIGYLTQISIRINNDGFLVSFNEKSEIHSSDQGINEENIALRLEQSVNRNNDSIFLEIEKIKRALADQGDLQKQFESYAAMFTKKNNRYIKNQIAGSEQQQLKQFNSMLNQLLFELNEQRDEDLATIKANFNNLVDYIEEEDTVNTDR